MPTHGLARQYASVFSVLHRVIDALLIKGCLWLAMVLYGVQMRAEYHVLIAWAIVFFLLLAEFRGLYSSWRTTPLRDEALRVALLWVSVVVALIFVGFITKTTDAFSRAVMVMWACMVPLALVAERALVRTGLRLARSKGRNSKTVALVGVGPLTDRVIEAVREETWMGLRLLGVYEDRADGRMLRDTESGRLLRGSLDDLVREAREGKVDYVYIALPMKAEQRVVEVANALADTTASVYFVPDVFISDLMNSRWISLNGVPVVSVFESPFFGVDGWLKRIEDLVLGSAIVLLAAIPMLAIALGIKMTSRGPVIFRQKRYGLNGKVVEVMKFRTMTVTENGDKVPQAKRDDPRVTRFGAFLRRTSLDELPQFFNVLMGDMSIVGPRPHAVAHNEQYRRLIHGYMLRHKVKPGITGLAQVNGWRGETDTLEKMEKRVEHDLEYVRDWSLMLDLKIIALTIVRGFNSRNAY